MLKKKIKLCISMYLIFVLLRDNILTEQLDLNITIHNRNNTPLLPGLRTLSFKRRHIKHILIVPFGVMYEYFWGSEGARGFNLFTMNKCPIKRCYLTSNINFFGPNISNFKKFDAVLLYGKYMNCDKFRHLLPTTGRRAHQKYIYMNDESAGNYPKCTKKFNRYYNWTATYKLDSDIQLRYFSFTDMNGTFVAPKQKPDWIKDIKTNGDINDTIMNIIQSKTKAAAVFVSNCITRSDREILIGQIHNELQKFGLGVDVFGNCGTLTCAKGQNGCDWMLEKNYFFYLAFENSISEDYVTEKVLHGLRNTVVPIVYGGAEYSKFLPPDSYIDARKYSSAEKLAIKMKNTMDNLQVYAQYFRWKSLYQIHDEYGNGTFARASCELCAMLHNRKIMRKHFSYKYFRIWWSPNYRKDCPAKCNNMKINTDRYNNF